MKCLKRGTDEIYAVKVIKNKFAYTKQAMTEIRIYKKLMEEIPYSQDYIVELHDYFSFRNHICLVFEMLNVPLFELLRLSGFTGLSMRLVQRLSSQIIDGMACLEKRKVIQCDLKPENVLFVE